MGKRVLIVDDDEKLRNLVKEYLEDYGFRVHAMPDGRLLMETLREHEPEIVLLDLMLPFKDGLELLREVRAAGDTPVIMLTPRGRIRTGSSAWKWARTITSRNPSIRGNCLLESRRSFADTLNLLPNWWLGTMFPQARTCSESSRPSSAPTLRNSAV